ncbi:MAG: 5-methyltetrahydropteroyltriglutamate--homocysteine S-methyltransferase, partial [Pseudomonadota bacterium]
AEDGALAGLIAAQVEAGMPVVTDGEMRRSFWHYDFLGMLEGFDLVERSEGVQFAGIKLRPIFPTITSKLGFGDHPMIGHFEAVAAAAPEGVTPKISIPGPSCVHFRTAKDDIAPAEYQDPEALFADIVATYRDALKAFYAAGCRYLQFDDIFFAYLCDPKHRAEKEAQGDDPDWLIGKYAEMMDAVIADRPDDMIVGMHMCRGNFRSTHAADGGYDPAADAVLNRIGMDVYFMEYDTERAGGLAPLAMLPKGDKRIMAGFVTTKTGDLEEIDDLKRRFDEASAHVDLDQLGLAPQCGFASTEEGNEITEDDQKRKLELVVKASEAIWG